MRSGLLVAIVAFVLAGCGSGGGEGVPGGAADTGPAVDNPRVNAVLDCLGDKEETSSAYALDVNAISVNTEQNGVEIYFDKTAAGARKRKTEIESTGIGIVFVDGTVVESWVSPPTPDERSTVRDCIAKDPGPGGA